MRSSFIVFRTTETPSALRVIPAGAGARVSSRIALPRPGSPGPRHTRRHPPRFLALLPALLVFFVGVQSVLPPLAAAELGTGIDAFLQDWEGQMTSAAPGFHEGQTRGFISGGSFDMRFPNRTATPFALSLPRIQSGCGGISIMGGAFSFINMEQFIQYLQSIAQNAMGMAFNMALTTLCPQCAVVMNKLEQMAREVAGNLKSSCQMSKNLFAMAGLTPDKFAATAHENCKSINATFGKVADWWEGDSVCRDPGETKKAEDTATHDWRSKGANPFTPPNRTSSNVFWDAYSRLLGGLPEYTPEFGEDLMSLFGTVVLNLKNADDANFVDSKEPRLSVRDLVDGYTDHRLWRCAETTECLDVNEALAGPYVGLKQEIATNMAQYSTDMEDRTRGTISSYLTVNISGIPLITLLTRTAHVPGANQMIIENTARYVAILVLRAYTQQLANAIQAQLSTVKDSGQLQTYLRHFAQQRQIIQAEFEQMQAEVSRGLQIVRDYTAIVHSNAGSNASMFTRHTAFSGKVLKSGAVGR